MLIDKDEIDPILVRNGAKSRNNAALHRETMLRYYDLIISLNLRIDKGVNNGHRQEVEPAPELETENFARHWMVSFRVVSEWYFGMRTTQLIRERERGT